MGEYTKKYSKTLKLSIPAYSLVQKEGCSDREFNSSKSSGDVASEFSSTPNTSVESTLESSPLKDPQPSTSTGNIRVQSREKDLSLLMKPSQMYQTPSESLYFREMVRTKTTPKQNPRKSNLEVKQGREQIPTTLPKKSGPRIKYTQRKQNRLKNLPRPKQEMPTTSQEWVGLRGHTVIIQAQWHSGKLGGTRSLQNC